MAKTRARQISRPGTKLFVRDQFAEVGDVVLNAGDLLRPGNQAWVRYSGSVLAFGFGKRFECVFQLLLQRGTGHKEGYHSAALINPHLPMQPTGTGSPTKASALC